MNSEAKIWRVNYKSSIFERELIRMSRKTAMKMGRPIADKITKAESVVVKTKKGTNTAETFVCNHLMYGILYTLAKKYPHIKGGFTHVPFIPEQVARRTPVAPYMALEDIKRGLEAAIAAIDKNFDADINVNGGKEF